MLNLRANGTVEFKSSTCAAVTDPKQEDKIPACAEFGDQVSSRSKVFSQAKRNSDVISKISSAERNLNFIQ